MATYLLRAQRSSPARNSTQVNGVIVSGVADEAAARSTAKANSPNGETRIHDLWISTQLSASDISPTLIWFEGDCVAPALGDKFRGS